MKKKIFFLVLALITYNSSFAQESEEKLIKKTFDNYKSSILNGKGEEAVNYVDSQTINYYSNILGKIINADSTIINSLGLLDKLIILSIRHQVESKDILSFNGQGLFVHAIEKGMIGKNSVNNNTIGDIEINEDFAKGQLISSGQKTPFHLHFHKENNKWKFNLTSTFSIGEVAFKKIQEDSGQEENEYLIMLLEIISGKKPDNKIWHAIQ